VSAVSVIEARDLTLAYGEHTVWTHANFDVAAGEFVAVLGPNGAGKSSLVKLVLGLLRPAAGELRVFGTRPHRGNAAIGYLPQRRPLDAELRLVGAELVRLGLVGPRWGMGLPRWLSGSSDVDDGVTEALSAVGAASSDNRAVGTLSGGELQRLLLAQALVSQPRLLALDEPLASLDVRNQLRLADVIATLARRRAMTVLLVAHDVNPLLPVIDRVLYVARGRIAIGPPSELITSERLSALYDTSVEVLRDRQGRLFVLGLEDESAHPHDLEYGEARR